MNGLKVQSKEEYNYKLDNTLESKVNQMCNFSQYVKEEGINETMIQNIINIMDRIKCSINHVIDILKLSQEDKHKYH